MEFLKSNFDYWIFSLFYLCFFILLARRMRDSKRGPKFPPVLWGVLLLILSLGFFLTQRAGNEERSRLEKMVGGFAPTYAEELARMGHGQLPLSVDPQDPDYLRMIEAQKRWLQLNPAISDIYTLRKDASGKLTFLVDSETDYDRNGKIEGKREERTPIGEIFDVDDPGLQKAFAGEANFEDLPVRDRWGTWVSAYVPMFGSDGKVEGVVGVDFPAQDWVRRINGSRWLVMAFLAGVLTILAVALSVITQLRFNIRRREEAEKSLQKSAEDLARAKLAAESASRAKGEFLANMSHEIRTPLSGIIGMADLVLENNPRPDQRENLEALRSSAEDLGDLLNDVLDLSKIEAEKVYLEEIDFDLRDLILRAVKTLQARFQQKGLTEETYIDPRLPFSLRGDPVRLRQVILNLVGNAVKFTEVGRVTIRVDLLEEMEESALLRITVADTGVGIPAGKQGRIFESFTQADSSTTRRYGGTGLGLAISAKLVNLMGGTLSVKSEEGHGSTFTFSLLLAKGHGLEKVSEPAPVTEARERSTEQNLQILLAEDNPVNQKVAQELLGQRGHRILVAVNGLEVLQLLEKGYFDLIILDVQMPEMDGYQTARAIRKNEARTGDHIPIFAMTAHAMPEDEKKCLDSGMDRVLYKPLDREKLLQEIDGYFNQAPLRSSQTFDQEAMLRRIDGNRRLLREISALFFEDSRRSLDRLKHALERHSASEAEHHAHNLKGMIANFAFPSAYSAAEWTEAAVRLGQWDEAARAYESLVVRVRELERGLRQMAAEPVV